MPAYVVIIYSNLIDVNLLSSIDSSHTMTDSAILSARSHEISHWFGTVPQMCEITRSADFETGELI